MKGLLVAAAVILAVAWTASAALSERPLPVAPAVVVNSAYIERPDTVRDNETLSHLFSRHNISGNELVDVLNAAEGLNPRRIRPGQVFGFNYRYDDPIPSRIDHRLGEESMLTLERDSLGEWTGRTEEIVWTAHREFLQGVIEPRSSLWLAITNAISDSLLPLAGRSALIDALSDRVFGFVIDFGIEIRPGDRFSIVYERLTSPLGDKRFGRIEAAKVETNGRENSAYVLSDANQRNIYYDEQGRSLRRAFKLIPLEFSARVSSGFSRSRLHPVLKIRRPHPGTDYAARMNSRIIATAGGTVTRAGRWGSYGIMVAIRHAGGFETRYGHMSRLAREIEVGKRVEQGQVIGFVGMTGLVNGPHVHYELIKNGQPINSRTMQQDSGEPVPDSRRAEFEAAKAEYDRLLARMQAPIAAATNVP